PRDRSSSTVTSHPSRRYASAMWEPMNPAPPVTNTRPHMRSHAPWDRRSVTAEGRLGCTAPQYRCVRRGRNREKTMRRGGHAPAPHRSEPAERSARQLGHLARVGAGRNVGRHDVDDPRGGGMLPHVDDLEGRHQLVDPLAAVGQPLRVAPNLEYITGRYAIGPPLVEEEDHLRRLHLLPARPAQQSG